MDEYIVDIAKRYRNQSTIGKQKLQIEYMLDPTRAGKILGELAVRGLVRREGDTYIPTIDDKGRKKLEKEFQKAQKKALKEERKHAKRM